MEFSSLLVKLVQRRRLLKELLRLIPEDTDLDDEEAVENVLDEARKRRLEEQSCFGKILSSTLVPFLRLFGCALSEKTIWKRVQRTTDEIKKLQQLEYYAAAVFVTFETEQGQRTALEGLNASKIEISRNKPMSIDASALFRGNFVSLFCLVDVRRYHQLIFLLYRYYRSGIGCSGSSGAKCCQVCCS